MNKQKIVVLPVHLAIAVPADADATDVSAFVADAANEILREHQREFAPASCLLDYEVCIDQISLRSAVDPDAYSEGDAFTDTAPAPKLKFEYEHAHGEYKDYAASVDLADDVVLDLRLTLVGDNAAYMTVGIGSVQQASDDTKEILLRRAQADAILAVQEPKS